MRALTVGHSIPRRASWGKPAPPEPTYGYGAPVLVPRLTRYPSAAAALDALAAQWARLLDLTAAWNALEGKRAALEGKLGDPALAEHPKRPAAERRWSELWRERGERLALIEAQCVVVARIWASLPEEARAAWPERWPGELWAARDAIERRLGLLVPREEVPF